MRFPLTGGTVSGCDIPVRLEMRIVQLVFVALLVGLLAVVEKQGQEILTLQTRVTRDEEKTPVLVQSIVEDEARIRALEISCR